VVITGPCPPPKALKARLPRVSVFISLVKSYESLCEFLYAMPRIHKKLPGISRERNKRKISDAYTELGGKDFERPGCVYSRKPMTRRRILTET